MSLKTPCLFIFISEANVLTEMTRYCNELNAFHLQKRPGGRAEIPKPVTGQLFSQNAQIPSGAVTV